MKKYIFIAAGGALGAISRFCIKGIHINNGNFPVNTLIINLTGSFVIALVLTLAYEMNTFNENVKLGITTGFLGAFTTFSTMCKEAVMLFQKGMYNVFGAYLLLSVLLGVSLAYLGAKMAVYIAGSIYREDTIEDSEAS